MDIRFKNSQLEKLCTNPAKARKKFGAETAQMLANRLRRFKAAESLQDINARATNLHALSGDRKGCFAVNLDKKNRLVFMPILSDEDEAAGKIATAPENYRSIRIIEIQEIGDYH